jgi:filamentous hemagglutinin
MNRNLYRIVFNKRRGQLMVVAENAGSAGKAGGRETVMTGGARRMENGSAPLPCLRLVCLAVSGAAGTLMLLAVPVHAQIVADPNVSGSQRPTVLQTASGVPQVNIQTPSPAGVSRNTYSQFDVQGAGAILNNSRTNVQSQIGGWVQGNPWLAGGSARVILNEVNSSNPSQLHGYVEVAGQRAEVVIANPAGLNVDGGGFINASRVTLTTGTPIVNGGSLDGFMVERGLVTIGGQGLDTSQSDYTGILARAAQVNAGIWAKQLQVVTGANQIDAQHGVGAVLASEGAAPGFALDVAQLGGMYAGKITLVGTEAGVGARNAGTLAAMAGSVVLQANGWLTNSGSIQASGAGSKVDVAAAGDVRNSGAMYASGDTNVVSGGDIANSGSIAAQRHTTLRADGAASRIESAAGSLLASGLNADNTLGSSGDLTVAATGGIALHGTGVSVGNTGIAGSRLDLAGATIAGGAIVVSATEGDVNASGAAISAQGSLGVDAMQTVRTDGAQLTGQQIGIAAHDLSNVGGQIAQLGAGDLAIRLPGQLDNTQGRIATNSANLTLAAATLTNIDGKIDHAGTGTLAITAGQFNGQRGQVTANGALVIAADVFDHRNANSVGSQVTIQAGALDNSGGKIDASGAVALSAGTLNNDQGRIAAGQGAAIAVAAAFNNTGGTLAGSTLSLAAGDVDNTRGQVQAVAGNATLSVAHLNNTAGSVFAGANLNTTAASVDNGGSLYAGGNQNLHVIGAIANGGVIAAGGNTTVAAGRMSSGAASLLGAGVRVDGMLASGGDLNIAAIEGLVAGGQNLAAGSAVLKGASVDLSGSQTSATNIAVTAAAGDVDTSGALVTTPGTLAITALAQIGQNWNNRRGDVIAGQLRANLANLDNTQGNIVQTGAGNTAINLEPLAGTLDNTGGRIAVNGANLTVGAATLVNAGGSIEHAGAGTLTVQAGVLDNSGGRITSAQSATIESAGALNNSAGVMAAANKLQIKGQGVDNNGGLLQAVSGALTLDAASLRNGQGEVSAGSDLSIHMSGDLLTSGLLYAGRDQNLAVGGALNNSGSIASLRNTAISAGSVNSSGLLGAGLKADGSLASAGNLNVATTQGFGATGQNLAAGDMIVGAAAVDLSSSQTRAANIAVTATANNVDTSRAVVTTSGLLTITANALLNSEGQLGAAHMSLNVATLGNAGGDIVQGGAGPMLLNTDMLDNTAGRIVAASGSLNVAAGTVLNTGGTLAATQSLALSGGDVDNTRGQIQAVSGNATLSVGHLNNAAGSVFAGADLDTVAGSVDNSGSLYAGGKQTLQASGAIVNGGVIAAGGNTTITAASVSSGAASLVGAGVKSDGTLGLSGDLAVATAQSLVAGGQNIAAGSANLSGASVDLSGSQTSAANIAVTAAAGNVDTSGAAVSTAGTLAITAHAQDGQSWNNRRGDVIAGQLQANVANLDNTSGGIVQTGTGNTAINLGAPTGTLDNTGGRIAVNSANLTLGANTLVNAGGSIEHAGAGTLAVNVATLNDQGGQITANGSLAIAANAIDHRGASTVARQVSMTADTLDNRAGNITQLGNGQTSIQVHHSLDNSTGTIASNGNTGVNAGTLNNQGGILQAGGSSNLDVSTGGLLDNRNAGTIAAGGNASISGGTVANQGGTLTAGGTLIAAATRAISNIGGLLAAGSDVAVTAASFDNTGGKLASVQGNLTLATVGNIANDSGQIRAAGNVTLVNGGMTNSQSGGYDGAGSIAGRNVSIDTNGQALNNYLGTIGGTQAVMLQTGALNNDGGLIQSGTALSIDTHGQALTNTNAGAYALRHPGSVGGLASDGSASLNLGSWNNTNGFFGAAGNITGSAGQLDNAGGQIVGKSGLALDVAGLNSQGGQIQVVGNIAVNAGAGVINNDAGLIRSGATVSLSAATIDNRATQGANLGIEGIDVALNTANLNNTQGAVRADNNLTANSAGRIDNSFGLMSAGSALTLQDSAPGRSLDVVNTGGTVIGGQLTAIRAASLSGDGRVLSQQDMMFDLGGSFTLRAGAELIANRNATVSIAGDLVNGGKLQAGSTLTLGAANLDNAASGDINAGTTRIDVAGTLSNRGVIDGIHARLDAGTLNNLGTGRIYGDRLSIAAGSVTNDAEGGIAATIAARESLDIGAQTIDNREHALIFSGGNMTIGGCLNTLREACGWAGRVTNASATIEALGDLTLKAEQVNVLNSHISTELIFPDAPQYSVEYEAYGKRYVAGPDVSVGILAGGQRMLRTPDGNAIDFTQYDITRSTGINAVTSSDPGVIVAGNDLTIRSNKLVIKDSQTIAGNSLSVESADPTITTTKNQTVIRETGTVTTYLFDLAGRSIVSSSSYTLPDLIFDAPEGSPYQRTPAIAPGAKAALAVNGGIAGASAANADLALAAVVNGSANLVAVAAASGQGAATVTGDGGPHGTTRIGGAGQAGSIGTVAGAPATAAITGAKSSGPAPVAAGAAPVPGGAGQGRMKAIAQVALANPGGRAQVVRTATQAAQVPNASLYTITPSPSAHYLVETDPRFTNYRAWTGSDYLLAKVQLDPSVTQKRLGDGFYEQQLVRDQVAQLTGQRFVGDYRSDEEQYRALMDAGAAYANSWHLRPGVALSAAQMAALTSDIVWLVEQDVLLADGSRQKALVPQVYVRVREGDLDGSGALLAGRDVNINVSGDLTNSGTIAGRDVVSINAGNVLNLGGRIDGDKVAVAARRDLDNISGTISANSTLVATAGRDINIATRIATVGSGNDTRSALDRVAGLYVTGDGASAGSLIASAGRDVSIVGAMIKNTDKDGTTAIGAGRDLNVTSSVAVSSVGATGSALNRTVTLGSELQAAGSLTLRAGSDINVGGSTVQAASLALAAGNDINNRGSSISANSRLLASAGRDINVVTGVASTASDTLHIRAASTVADKVASMTVTGESAGNTLVASAGRDVTITAGVVANAGKDGATVIGAGRDLNLGTVGIASKNDVLTDANNYRKESSSAEVGSQVTAAGSIALQAGNDMNVRAGKVEAGTSLAVVAGNNINIVAGVATLALDEAHQTSKKGFWSSKTTTTRDTLEATSAIASSLGGDSVTMVAGKDILVTGSAVLGDGAVSLTAGNDITIGAAVDTSREAHYAETKKSGFAASFSAGVASIGYGKSSTSGQSSLDEVSQRGASVESISGNTRIQAGQQLTVVASDISAAKNLTLIGGSIDLSAAQDTSIQHSTQQAKSSGLSIGVTLDPLAAFKNAYNESEKSNRGTSVVGKVVERGDAIAEGASAAMTPVVAQAGSRSLTGTQDHATSDARVSTLMAGENLTVLATGGNIASQGTRMSAEGDALFIAKGSITFDVAHSLESQGQDNRAKGASFDNRASLPAGAFNNKGNGQGTSDTATGTSLSVGGKATLATTEGDITLTGANVVAGGDTTINAGNNLTIQSAQNSVANDNHSNNKAIGKVVISDTERFAGYHNAKHNDSEDALTQVASSVGSLQGNVTLTAGEKYTQTASNVLALSDVNITAKSIDITAAANTGSSAQDNTDLKIGMFARISSPVIDLVNNVEGAKHSDGRLQAMQGMAAVANAYQAASAAAGTSGTLFKAEVGVGFSSAGSKDRASGSEAQGSTIKGGGNITLTSTEGDINATGAAIAAGKVLTLSSAKDIMLASAESRASSEGKNRSAGVEVGVGYSVGAQTGVYAYAAANAGHGEYKNAATVNGDTHLTGETVTLTSKGDTTLKGADVKADTIHADVKGKLAIESVQDTSRQHNEQSNVGARVQVSFGIAWEVSGNLSQSTASGSGSTVNEQSGLFAGDGGYHVRANTIALTGGAIASTNAENSELTTNAITFEHLANRMDYKAQSASIAGGFSVGGGGKGDGAQTQTSTGANNPNFTPGLPMQDKGGASSTTYATLTDGKLIIGGQSMTSAASLGAHTDLPSASKAIAALPDLKVLMADQQAMAAAAGTVIAASGQIAGDIAKAAHDRGEQASKDIANADATIGRAQAVINDADSTPEQRAQAQQNVDLATQNRVTAQQVVSEAQTSEKNWSATGDYTRALKVVTGVLVGGVGGQRAGQVAANAGAPYAADAIGDYFTEPGHENQTAQVLSHAVLGAILASANGGSALGGAGAGAAGEVAAQVISRELYPHAYDADGSFHPDRLSVTQTNTVVALATGVGALVAGAGGGALTDAAVGGNVAANAATNNYLNHKRTAFNKPSEQAQFDASVARCDTGNASACAERDQWIALSQSRDQAVTNACTGGSSATCRDQVVLAQNAGNKIIFGSDGKAVVYPIGSPELVATPAAGEGGFHDQVSKGTLDGLLLDIGGVGGRVIASAGVKVLRSIWYGTTDAVKLADTAVAASLGGSKGTLTATPVNGATRTVSLGFQSEIQQAQAINELQGALTASGITDATIGVRGSSVTGLNYRTGASFSAASDIDVFIESAQLTNGLSTSKNIPGLVHPNLIMKNYPYLDQWANDWTKILGRDITPGAFTPGKIPDHPAILFKK